MYINERNLPNDWDHLLNVRRDGEGHVVFVRLEDRTGIAEIEIQSDSLVYRVTQNEPHRRLSGDEPTEDGVGEPPNEAEHLVATLVARAGGTAVAPAMHCSFCGKSQREVRKLIAGPSVYICDECVSLCSDILSEDLPG